MTAASAERRRALKVVAAKTACRRRRDRASLEALNRARGFKLTVEPIARGSPDRAAGSPVIRVDAAPGRQRGGMLLIALKELGAGGGSRDDCGARGRRALRRR